MSAILQYEFSSLATIHEDSVSSFDTTVAAGTAAVSDTGSTEAYGNTAHFDGSTSFEMSTVPTTLTDNSTRSCSVWLYSTTSGAEQRILSTNSGTGITIFQKRTDNKLTVQNSVFGTFSTSTIPLNTWTHCAFTYNGSNTVKVYFDGNLEGTNTWAMNLSTQDMKYIGGTGTAGSTFFNGNMLDMRIYDVELDATQIGTLFSNGPDHIGVLFPEPILWYKLNEESASIGTDDSGNTTNMTNVNVVSITDTSPSNYGQVADFSGGTLTLPVANVPSAIIGSSSRTYSFWLESNVVANTQIIDIGSRNLTGRDLGINVNGSQKIGITLFNTPGIQSTTVMTAGVWYYVVVSFEDVGNLLSIYVDGTLETQESKTVNTGSTDLEFGEDDLGFQDMRLLDMRIYDVALDATEISTLYAAGPDIVTISTGLDATIYTHICDLTWDAISGASEYTVRQIKDGGSDEEDVIKTDLLTGTVNLDNSSTYIFNLYSDLDLVTAEATVNVSPLAIDQTNVSSLMTRIQNNLSILDDSAIPDIEDFIQGFLLTGDQVILPSGKSSIFVENLDTHTLGTDELNILTPFTPGVAGDINVTLPNSSIVTYTHSATNEVDGNSVGDYFISGGYMAHLKDVPDA